jgi:hypothetical protein
VRRRKCIALPGLCICVCMELRHHTTLAQFSKAQVDLNEQISGGPYESEVGVGYTCVMPVARLCDELCLDVTNEVAKDLGSSLPETNRGRS